MKHLIAAALLTPCLALASPPIKSIGVHTLTRHDPGLGANDINIGTFAAFNNGFVVGGYYNSFHRMAYYGGWSTPEWYRLKLSVIGVTGYFAPVTIVAVPSLKIWQEQRFSVWLSGSPVRLTEDGQSVLHITLEWAQ